MCQVALNILHHLPQLPSFCRALTLDETPLCLPRNWSAEPAKYFPSAHRNCSQTPQSTTWGQLTLQAKGVGILCLYMSPRRVGYNETWKWRKICVGLSVCVCVYIWLGSGGSYYNLFLSKGQRTGDGLRSKHWTKRQSWLKTERVKVKALLSVLSAPNQRGKNSLPKNSEGNRRGDLPIFWVLLSSSHLPLAVQAQEQMNCLSYRPEWS